MTNGTYALSQPSVSCTYNAIGDYYVTLYLQDASHPTDYTQLDEFVVQVVTGTPGATCNVNSLAIGDESVLDTNVTSDISNPSTEGLGNFLDFFTGGDENSQIFIGFILLILIILAVGGFIASVTHSGVAVAVSVVIAGIVGFICLTAIGLFPVWILILILLFMALTSVLAVAFKMGGS